MAPQQSVEIVDDADLEVMQGEALRSTISDWLQNLRAGGTPPRPENSRSLRKQFIDEMLGEVFEILPQRLRESDDLLGTHVSYLINDFLTTEAEDNVEVDASLPLHQRIWDAMLAKARVRKSRGTNEYRYQSIIDNQGSAKLFALIEECADDFIWKHCVVGGKALDAEFLHSMEEDYQYQQPGWYLIFMWDEECQVWEWYRVYVGQAGAGQGTKTLLTRVGQHRTCSTNVEKKQLVYRAWRAFEKTVDLSKMKKVKFVKLGFAPDQGVFSDPEDADLFLSLGEMYFSLVFRSLQTQDLIKWLPEGTVAKHSDLAPLGLNVALPLSQGRVLESTMAFGKLANSLDPQVREDARRTLKQNIQKVYDDHFVKNTATLRKNAAWADENVFRDGPVGQTVQVKCNNCGWVKDDLTPRYIIRTGQYLSRQSGCETCPVKDGDKKANRRTSRRCFVPADDTIPSERSTLLYKRLAKDGWPEYYKGVRALAPLNRKGE